MSSSDLINTVPKWLIQGWAAGNQQMNGALYRMWYLVHNSRNWMYNSKCYCADITQSISSKNCKAILERKTIISMSHKSKFHTVQQRKQKEDNTSFRSG